MLELFSLFVEVEALREEILNEYRENRVPVVVIERLVIFLSMFTSGVDIFNEIGYYQSLR